MLLDSIDFLQKNNRNAANLKILRQSLETGSLSHAYLFCGSNIEYLSKLALFFASSINCEQNGCGTCNICLNTLKEIYPNLLMIEADGIILTKEKVVDLQKFASMSAHNTGKKICIVKEVELMNKEASNRFLKTLEDPPDANSIFILLSEDLSGILPTIASRCSVFEWDFIHKSSDDDKIGNSLITDKLNDGIRKVLKQHRSSNNVKSSEIHVSAADTSNNNANNGNPVFVLMLSMDLVDILKQESLTRDTDWQELASKIKSTGATASEIKKIEEKIKTKNKRMADKYYNLGINNVFDIISAWLEDIIAVRLGASREALNNGENYAIISQTAVDLKIEKAFRLLEDIENTRNYLKYSIYTELALDNILLKLQGLY
jgi:DNA polymerase III delta prime subunit